MFPTPAISNSRVANHVPRNRGRHRFRHQYIARNGDTVRCTENTCDFIHEDRLQYITHLGKIHQLSHCPHMEYKVFPSPAEMMTFVSARFEKLIKAGEVRQNYGTIIIITYRCAKERITQSCPCHVKLFIDHQMAYFWAEFCFSHYGHSEGDCQERLPREDIAKLDAVWTSLVEPFNEATFISHCTSNFDRGSKLHFLVDSDVHFMAKTRYELNHWRQSKLEENEKRRKLEEARALEEAKRLESLQREEWSRLGVSDESVSGNEADKPKSVYEELEQFMNTAPHIETLNRIPQTLKTQELKTLDRLAERTMSIYNHILSDQPNGIAEFFAPLFPRKKVSKDRSGVSMSFVSHMSQTEWPLNAETEQPIDALFPIERVVAVDQIQAQPNPRSIQDDQPGPSRSAPVNQIAGGYDPFISGQQNMNAEELWHLQFAQLSDIQKQYYMNNMNRD